MKTLIIDLETTGFGSTAEILQIGIIDSDGHILMNQYIRPAVCELTERWGHAIEIHGITPERVANCPSLVSVLPAFIDITNGNHVVIYNALFDLMYIPDEVKNNFEKTSCCMAAYATKQNIKKAKLEVASKVAGFNFDSSIAHDAIYDCQATLAVWQWLNN